MKTAIVVYSATGNTMQVAERMKAAFKAKGETADLFRVTASGTSSKTIALANIPNVSAYDQLIIGAPINGFMLCRAMQLYLQGNTTVKGKKINFFVTQHLKHAFWGGNKGIKQMQELSKANGGVVNNSAIVHWSAPKREAQINKAVELMMEF